MSGITKVLKWLWRAVRAAQTVTVTLLFLIVVVAVIGALFADRSVKVPDGAALVVAPRGTIVETTSPANPWAVMPGQFNSQPAEVLLRDMVKAIRAAKDDDRIKALVLALDNLAGAGPAKLAYLATVIEDFKTSGKPVIALGHSYSQSQYYLAAHADEIYMSPLGAVMLTGYGAYRPYFKSGLDKLKANVHVFRVGTFKSAVEPFIRDDMSPEAKQANLSLLSVLWDRYLGSVSDARGLPEGALAEAIADMADRLRAAGGDMARMALESGLVDGLESRQATRNRLIETVGPSDNGDTFKQINMATYLAAVGQDKPAGRDKIAVIAARGEILMGDHGANRTGAESLSRLIRQARNDDKVKALVFRIDSPGGSAAASEIIRQELVATQQAGIPVIASFSTLAASGGYWIAATTDEIWSEPTTITGSIGIFGMLPTFEETLDEVGIHTDGVGTTPWSGAMSATRPLAEPVKDMIQQSIEAGYRRFLALVAEGRDMTPEDVDTVAQGRVWAGATALDLGLVDKLGSIDDAIEAAAARAGTDSYRVAYFERPPTTAERLAKLLFSATGALGLDVEPPATPDPIAAFAHRLFDDAALVWRLNDPNAAYALCSECPVP